MRRTATALANIAATGILTMLFLREIAWLPGAEAVSNYVVDTAQWRWFRAADAALRLALGATVGPESDEMMLVWCSLALCFLAAVTLVWLANLIAGRAWSRAHRSRVAA